MNIWDDVERIQQSTARDDAEESLATAILEIKKLLIKTDNALAIATERLKRLEENSHPPRCE